MISTAATAGSQGRGFVGLDVGGANTKAARLSRGRLQVVTLAFEVWRERDALAQAIRRSLDAVGRAGDDEVALTMTAELSDAFRSKREGVEFVIGAVQAAMGGRSPRVLTTAGELLSTELARSSPLAVAAANWVATALEIAAVHPDALMVDVGSTTADIIPLAGGRVAAHGRTDLDRLLAGELVYTGALRTNLATIAPRVPVRGGSCPVASELFAISADLHLILGHISSAEYSCPTPDGRGATVGLARERLARLVCADSEQLETHEVDAIAAYLHRAQVEQLAQAARRAGARCRPDAPVVALGVGSFLARQVAARIGRPLAEAPAAWTRNGLRAASAAALASLLARRLAGWR